MIQNLQNSSLGGMFSANISGSSVTMFVCTPRAHYNIIVRPTVVNFTPGVIDELNQFATAEEATSDLYGNHKRNLRTAILPAHQGNAVNTSMFDQLYSFIMIVDTGKTAQNQYNMGAKANRIVLTGYFLDEPFVTHTLHSSSPIPNMGARLMFTKESMSVIHPSGYGSGGGHARSFTTANDDIVGCGIGMAYQNPDIRVCDVSSVANATVVGNDQGEWITAENLTNPACLDENIIVNSTARSPKHQLGMIANAIDTADRIAHSRDHVGGGMADGRGRIMDPLDEFIQTMRSNMVQGTNLSACSVQFGLNVREPTMSLEQLNTLAPDMQVLPINTPSHAQFDICNQADISPSNTMRSLIASSLPAIATNHGLAAIQFRYDSWSMDAMASAGGYPGKYEVYQAVPMMGGNVTPEMLGASVDGFLHSMIVSIYPIVSEIIGEFSVSVDYHMGDSTHVQLEQMDNADSFEGIWTTPNCLGGIVSPSIGNSEVFNNNSAQLREFTNAMAEHHTGKQFYAEPYQ